MDGILSINVLTGIALDTKFIITAKDYQDADLPLSFKF